MKYIKYVLIAFAAIAFAAILYTSRTTSDDLLISYLENSFSEMELVNPEVEIDGNQLYLYFDKSKFLEKSPYTEWEQSPLMLSLNLDDLETIDTSNIFDNVLFQMLPYSDSKIKLTTYDIRGKKIIKLFDKIEFSGKKYTFYFDEDWNRTSDNQAPYYREVRYGINNQPVGWVKDYYSTGRLQNDFHCRSIDTAYNSTKPVMQEGLSTEYYEDGQIKAEQNYTNGVLNGKTTWYYEDGQIESESNHTDGTNRQLIRYISKDGVITDERRIKFTSLDNLKDLYGWELLKLDDEIGWVDHKKGIKWQGSDGGYDYGYTKVYDVLNQNNFKINAEGYFYSSKRFYSNMGLLVGYVDWDNYCSMQITENKKLIVKAVSNGIIVKEVTIESNDIWSSYNDFSILSEDGVLHFIINGNEAGSFEYELNPYGGVGLMTSGSHPAVYNALHIASTPSKQTLIVDTSHVAQGEIEWRGNGSGIFVDEAGYIATNYHVIKDANTIGVEYYSSGVLKKHFAEVVISDETNDLAILRIIDKNFSTLNTIPYTFGTKSCDVGTEVFTLGYPMALNLMGKEIKYTNGSISSKTGFMGDITTYQISVPIQGGNSGGPLFDYDGNLVALTASGIKRSLDLTENVNYAIKSTYLKSLTESMNYEIQLPDYYKIKSLSTTEKIKKIKDFVVLIKVD